METEGKDEKKLEEKADEKKRPIQEKKEQIDNINKMLALYKQ